MLGSGKKRENNMETNQTDNNSNDSNNSLEIFPTFEPKTASRYIAFFKDSTGQFLPNFVIRSIDRPKFNRDILTKTIEWLPINVSLYDPIVPSTPQALFSHIDRDETFDITIRLLGPVGDVVEEWGIVDANIISADFGTMEWKLIDENEKFTIEQPNCTIFTKVKPLLVNLKLSYEYATLRF